MNSKLLGSILLIIGTSIGAGMLALPIATAELGFTGSIILLFICWFVMTTSALLILEVNLWLPHNSNLISMARATIGPIGQVAAWAAYLLLLYSLLCAYIAGGSDLLHNLLSAAGVSVPRALSAITFVLLFGTIVYFGIRSVDYVNRGLIFAKFAAYFLLIFLLTPFISYDKLSAGVLSHLTQAAAITVTIASFGFATIVPSLRIYFAGDDKSLRKAIIIGSFIPLVLYIVWDAAIMGIIPLTGEHGLAAILKSNNSTSDLVNTLNSIAAVSTVSVCLKFFTSICVLTSFLGVALCLTDFLADGLHLEKEGASKLVIHLGVMLPPLIIVLFFPNAFLKALEYAGIYCIVLLVLLPSLMAWSGRYYKKYTKSDYHVPGGKFLLIGLMIFSVTLIIRSFVG